MLSATGAMRPTGVLPTWQPQDVFTHPAVVGATTIAGSHGVLVSVVSGSASDDASDCRDAGDEHVALRLSEAAFDRFWSGRASECLVLLTGDLSVSGRSDAALRGLALLEDIARSYRPRLGAPWCSPERFSAITRGAALAQAGVGHLPGVLGTESGEDQARLAALVVSSLGDACQKTEISTLCNALCRGAVGVTAVQRFATALAAIAYTGEAEERPRMIAQARMNEALCQGAPSTRNKARWVRLWLFEMTSIAHFSLCQYSHRLALADHLATAARD